MYPEICTLNPWVLGRFFLLLLLEEELLWRHLESGVNTIGIVVVDMATDRFNQLFNGWIPVCFSKLDFE